MIRGIFTIMNIKVSQRINGLLYFLKRIPLIKNLLKNLNYSFIGFKKFLSVLSIIYSIIAGPVGFGLLFFVSVYLPSTTFLKGDILSSIMLFILSFLFLYRLLGSETMDPSQEKFIIVKQMKMNPKVFTISKMISDKLIELLSKGLVLALLFEFLLGKDLLSGVKIAIAVTMFGIFIEAVHLHIYKKTGFIMNKFAKTRVVIMLVGIAATYALIAFTTIPEDLNLFPLFTNTITTVISTILGIIGFIYLLKYDRYWDVLNEENKLDTFKKINENIKDIHFQEVKLKDKDFNEESLKENDNIDKKGYDYLNYIFFKRHKRVVYKPIIRKSLIIIVIFIAIFIVDKFFVEGFGKDTTNEIIDTYTILIFVIYWLCNATPIIKSLFYNCDRSLLRFGFYKQGDALLKMFFLRLKKILLANIVPVIVLCIGIVQLIYVYEPGRILESIPMIVSNLIVGVLFSVHYMFIYYILQPFTTDLKTKSPLYTIINVLVYAISYSLIILGVSAIKALPFILGLSIVYISMGIVLVYKKAPKTFRVK